MSKKECHTPLENIEAAKEIIKILEPMECDKSIVLSIVHKALYSENNLKVGDSL